MCDCESFCEHGNFARTRWARRFPIGRTAEVAEGVDYESVRRVDAKMRHLMAAILCAATASGFVIGRFRSPLPLALRCHGCHLAAGLPINESSTIAEMRAFIAEKGLDIKTTGKGRTKDVIYEEITNLSRDGAPAAAGRAGEPSGAEATPPEPEPELLAPNGFVWGGTF
jgi:hypothetical protein